MVFSYFSGKLLKMIALNVPVPVYVKKFMNSLYGNSYTLNLNDSLGKMTHSLLQKNIASSKGLLKPIGNSFFTIKVSYSKSLMEGCVISKNNIYQIADYCDKYFRETIYLYVLIKSLNQNSANIKACLREALSVFDITEDDISLDTLYRDFMRKRTEPPIANIFQKISG